MTVWTAVFLIVLVAEIVFLPCYLFAPFCKGARRQIISKCICALMFILIGLFAMLAADNYKPYAALMLPGLFFSAWGDYFLGVTTKGKIFVAGILSFTIAHIFYISAYVKVLAEKVTDRPFINLNELIAFAVLLAVLGVSSLLLKLDMGKLKALIFVYSAVIMAMLVKAVSLAKVLYETGVENSAAAVLLTGGAVLFVISDAVLSLMLFGGKDTRGMTVLNLSTYFSAQILLATSIYFVR
jgi:uncharacterized membrane protein YhhN